MSSPDSLQVGSVLVSRDAVRTVWALLRPGLRQAEREGWQLPVEVRDVVAGLRIAADSFAAPVADRIAEPVDSWVSVEVAASLLGVTPRWVRSLASRGLLRGRLIAGTWQLSEVDVLAEVEARGTVRNTSERFGSPDVGRVA